MVDWRQRLREIVRTRREAPDAEADDASDAGSMSPIAAFLETIVRPALRDVEAELAQYERRTRIDDGEDWISISVLDADGEPEFVFAVQGRPFYRMTFAFPELPDEAEADSYTADILVNGERHEREALASFTKADVIEAFLDAYAQWADW